MSFSTKYISLYLVFLFVMIGTGSVWAQTYHLKKEVLDMFSDSKGDLWVTTYLGYEDYIYPVDLVLGFDGVEYKGLLHYPDTKDKVYLEGNGSKEQFSLTEYNDAGLNIGNILITINESFLKGEWTTDENGNKTPMIFIEDKINRYHLPKSMNLLAGIYTGQFLGNEVGLTCYKERNTLEIYLEGKRLGKLYQLDPGIYTAKEVYTFDNLDLENVTAVLTDENIELSFDSEGRKIISTLTMESSVTASNNTFTTPYTHVLLQSLSSEYKALTNWISQQQNEISKEIKRVKEKNANDEYGDIDRNKEKLGLDIKVNFLDSRYISGDVYIYGLLNIEMNSFIYDKIKNKLLKFDDVIEESNIPQELQTQVKGKNQLLLNESGVTFSGPYNIIKGNEVYNISHEELKENYSSMIKNRTFRNHFLK